MGGTKSKPSPPPPLPDYPADTVVLHGGFGRGFNAPSLSPFVVKLETYLRVAKIDYKAVPQSAMSKKGKVPWIWYNGEEIADSEICIRYLNQKFNVDLQSGFSPEQRADVVAYRAMNDEMFYWCLVYERFIKTPTDALVQATKFPYKVIAGLQARFKVASEAQGFGRHSPEEMLEFADISMKALSDKLGDKPYLFGNNPTEADVAVFGNLVQVKYQMPGVLNDMMINKYPSLSGFVDRMKTEYWPDWDECHTHMNTKTPTK